MTAPAVPAMMYMGTHPSRSGALLHALLVAPTAMGPCTATSALPAPAYTPEASSVIGRPDRRSANAMVLSGVTPPLPMASTPLAGFTFATSGKVQATAAAEPASGAI